MEKCPPIPCGNVQANLQLIGTQGDLKDSVRLCISQKERPHLNSMFTYLYSVLVISSFNSQAVLGELEDQNVASDVSIN